MGVGGGGDFFLNRPAILFLILETLFEHFYFSVGIGRDVISLQTTQIIIRNLNIRYFIKDIVAGLWRVVSHLKNNNKNKQTKTIKTTTNKQTIFRNNNKK